MTTCPRPYANIIIDIAHEKLDHPFQYKIPEELRLTLLPGMSVSIPFGRGDRICTGVVLDLTAKAEYPPDKMKEILAIAPDSVTLTGDAIGLAAWMKKNYGSTMIAALKTVLPARRTVRPKIKRSLHRLVPPEQIGELLSEATRKHQAARERILTELLSEEILPYELVTGKLHISAATLSSLERQQIIELRTESTLRNPVKLNPTIDRAKQLSPEQQTIITEIGNEYGAGVRATYLIHGITGSGKTEV
jgi:primosomal protein N' (replication factor Y)